MRGSDTIKCHRGILITRKFASLGYQVIHILKDKVETQSEFESRLLDKYLFTKSILEVFTNV